MNEYHAASPQQDRRRARDVRLLGSISRNLGQLFVPSLQPEKHPMYNTSSKGHVEDGWVSLDWVRKPELHTKG